MQSTVFFRVPTRFSKALSLPEGISNYYWYNWAKRGTMCASSSGKGTTTVWEFEWRWKKTQDRRGKKKRTESTLAFQVWDSFHLSSGSSTSFRGDLSCQLSARWVKRRDSWVGFCSSKLNIYSTSYDLRGSSTNFTHQSVFTGVVK